MQYGVAPSYSLDACENAPLGEGFAICGAYARDPQDGDITSRISVTDVTPCPPLTPLCMRCAAAAASAGLCLPGKYLLRYAVSDSDGNLAEVGGRAALCCAGCGVLVAHERFCSTP